MLKAGAQAINQWRTRNPTGSINSPGVAFDGLDLSGADLSRANLPNASFRRANLSGVDLNAANVAGTSFLECDLTNVKFSRAILNRANFRAAHIRNVDFERSIGLSSCKNLILCHLSPGEDVVSLDYLEIPIWDKYISWLFIRKFGKLPLFVPAYFSLIVLCVYYYILAFYDDMVIQLHIVSGKLQAAQPYRNLVDLILPLITPAVPTFRSILLIIATLSFAVATTLYALFCPARIQEFTAEQWEFSLRQSRFYYICTSWNNRVIRIVCALAYFVGGSVASYLIIENLVRYVRFLLQILVRGG